MAATGAGLRDGDDGGDVLTWRWTGVLLGIGAALVYQVVGPEQAGLDSHLPVARAFLAGRVWFPEAYPWLELVPRPEGGWTSPFPPLISLVMVPFVAVGLAPDTGIIGAALGGLSVTLIWILLGRIGTEARARLGLTVAWAIGSEMLWIGATGGQHLAPQAASAALLSAALIAALDRRAVLAGLLIGIGVLARVPVVFAWPLVAWLLSPWAEAFPRGRRDPPAGPVTGPAGVATAPDAAPAAAAPTAPPAAAAAPVRALLPPFLSGVGLAVPVAVLGAYAWLRYGSPLELGYGLIRNVAGESVLDEPWYAHGIIALDYLPLGLHSMLLRGPELLDGFPWFGPSLLGTSILLMMPVLWWIAAARGRTALVAFVVAWLVLLPDLLHGNPGFAQAGYRYIVDALPILWVVLGIAFRDGMPRPAWVAVGAGVVASWWLFGVEWLRIAGVLPR